MPLIRETMIIREKVVDVESVVGLANYECSQAGVSAGRVSA
jgi:hypothetical protein